MRSGGATRGRAARRAAGVPTADAAPLLRRGCATWEVQQSSRCRPVPIGATQPVDDAPVERSGMRDRRRVPVSIVEIVTLEYPVGKSRIYANRNDHHWKAAGRTSCSQKLHCLFHDRIYSGVGVAPSLSSSRTSRWRNGLLPVLRTSCQPIQNSFV